MNSMNFKNKKKDLLHNLEGTSLSQERCGRRSMKQLVNFESTVRKQREECVLSIMYLLDVCRFLVYYSDNFKVTL